MGCNVYNGRSSLIYNDPTHSGAMSLTRRWNDLRGGYFLIALSPDHSTFSSWCTRWNNCWTCQPLNIGGMIERTLIHLVNGYHGDFMRASVETFKTSKVSLKCCLCSVDSLVRLAPIDQCMWSFTIIQLYYQPVLNKIKCIFTVLKFYLLSFYLHENAYKVHTQEKLQAESVTCN